MKPVRTDAANPNRCQGTSRHGQCPNLAEHGSNHCSACGGVSTKEQEDTRSYLLTQVEVKRRLAQLDTQLDPVRDLQRTISLVHLLIETHVNSAKSDVALMSACAPLEKLVQRMESLCKSVVTVQEKLNLLLPRSVVLSLGQSIVQIVIEELEGIEGYEQIVDRIINRIFPTITNHHQPKLLENHPNV